MATHTILLFFARGISGVGALISVVFIASHLSSSDQGIYYLFLSLLGTQALFELGLGQVYLQLLAHQYAVNGRLIENLNSELVYKFRKSAKKFFASAVLLGSLYIHTFAADEWLILWLLLVLVSSLNISLSPFLIISEARGSLVKASLWKLLLEFGYLLGLNLSLLCGFGINSIFIALAMKLIISVGVVLATEPEYLGLYFISHKNLPNVKNSRDEIFKKRIAFSWLVGYLYSTGLPALFYALTGPIFTGQFALSNNVFQGISSLANTVVAVNVPRYCFAIAHGDIDQLKRSFRNDSHLAFAVYILLVFAFVLFFFTAGEGYYEKILPVETILPLAVMMSINQYLAPQTVIVRAQKIEPYLTCGLVGCAVQLLVYGFGSYFDFKTTMFYVMLVYYILIGAPWSVSIYKTNSPWSKKVI